MAAVVAGSPASMQHAELMRRFTAFLDADDGQGALSARIREMVAAIDAETVAAVQSPRRLLVSIDSLRTFDTRLATSLLATPVDHLPVLERATQDLISGERTDLAADTRRLSEFRVGLEGSFGGRQVSPRGLSARLVGGVVCVEGIVTRATNIRPRLVVSVHYCPATGVFMDRVYKDASSVSSLAVYTQNAGLPGSAYPNKDDDGNPLETEFGKCWYRDFQRITLQEMPESSPPGQLPRSVEVFFEGDLCDSCKPGDRVRIVGIYRALGGTQYAGGTGVFKTVVVANNVMSLSGTDTRGGATSVIPMHDQDIRNIRGLAGKGKIFDKLARSIAPSICGHEYIKKALLLLLIGGKERNLANGTHLRGDINVMMCGDPSTAKSQLLRFILHCAPLALSTTGRGSSGVGLTAAVTSDPDTGERHLEAGAMVLADRGVVCIDEFDKMSDEDRVAIHEVMEQQTVTIAKAGIHASLNARCSVVAAANPVYGSYDKSRKPHENIALPDSLLSRFDLLFIVLDSSDADKDRLIADHVLKGHRFRAATHTLDDMEDGMAAGRPISGVGGSGGVSSSNTSSSAVAPASMYESAASSLYASQAAASNPASSGRRSTRRAAARADAERILSTEFLKRYINYAKTRASPTLSLPAAEYIAEAYSALRQDVDSSKTLPITARCLETLIRLATAHAKCRLDKVHVTREDAEVAVEVLRFALFNQAEPEMSEKAYKRMARKARKSKGSDAADEDSGDDDDDDDEAPAPKRKTRSRKVAEEDSGDDDEPDADDDEDDNAGIVPTERDNRSSGRAIRSRKPTQQEGNGSPGDRSRDSQRSKSASPTKKGSSSATKSLEGNNLPESAEAEGGSGPLEGRLAGDGSAVSVSDADVRRVMSALNAVRGRQTVAKFDKLLAWLAEEEDLDDEDAEPLSTAQVRGALQKMEEEEKVLLTDDNIFII